MSWDSLFDEVNEDPLPRVNLVAKQVKVEDAKKEIAPDPTICPGCNIAGELKNGQILCTKCGLKWDHSENVRNFSSDVAHYVVGRSHMAFKIVGQKSNFSNRSLMKTCSSYKVYSHNNNRREVLEKIFQHQGKKIPKDALKLGIEIFADIKTAGYVFRGNKKQGVVGACIFYACVIKGITKTPRDVAEMLEISEKFLSQGDRILQSLKEKGIVDIPTFLRPLPDFIKQYFSALHIPKKYAPFVIDLIARAEKKHIHIINESRMTTKCVGAILMLTMRVRSLRHITKDEIARECKISKSTFTRYYLLMCANHKKIRKVFKKHKIPMPDDWRPRTAD